MANKYGNINANKYLTGNMPHTYAAMEQAEEEANVKAGKTALKVMGMIAGGLFLLHVLTGCNPTFDNIISQGVCSTQSDPSIVCPNAGK